MTAIREIKFRAKSGTQWRYGDLYHNGRGELVIYEPKTSGQTLEGKTVDGWRIVVDPKTVGQFTELKDADGREVYEGDILANSHDVRVIEWRDYQWSMVSHTHPFQETVPMIWIGGYRVIGNIHDNPQLLKEGCGNA